MIKTITQKDFARHERMIREALRLASTHDPDHGRRLDILERQVQRLGAPEYRTLYKDSPRSRVK